MGKLIDADFILNKMETTEAQPVTYSERYAWDFATVLLNNAPTIEAIPKDQYEARLKADMIAMLTEIQWEIAEMKSYESPDGQDLVMLADIGILFQEKIDKLKGVER